MGGEREMVRVRGKSQKRFFRLTTDELTKSDGREREWRVAGVGGGVESLGLLLHTVEYTILDSTIISCYYYSLFYYHYYSIYYLLYLHSYLIHCTLHSIHSILSILLLLH